MSSFLIWLILYGITRGGAMAWRNFEESIAKMKQKDAEAYEDFKKVVYISLNSSLHKIGSEGYLKL